MSPSRKVTIFGRDHESAGELFSLALEPWPVALGTSVGVTSKANEDAVGVGVLDRDMLLALADGHWGRGASELAISKAVELLYADISASNDSAIRARLFALYEEVNTDLYEMAISTSNRSSPETTLIVCHLKETASGKALTWFSFGDSYIFLFRQGILKQLNSLKQCWLGYLSKMSENAKTRSVLMQLFESGSRYVGVAGGLETGVETLEPGDMVLLCSDGLIGSDEKPETSMLDELSSLLTSEVSLTAKVDTMIRSALRRGETDNISCLLAHIA